MKKKKIYVCDLREIGHSVNLCCKDQADPGTDEKRTWKRNAIWLNLHFNVQRKTNIGKMYFSVLNKHFQKGSVLYKFNRNTVNLS